jgi:hypothetical protein
MSAAGESSLRRLLQQAAKNATGCDNKHQHYPKFIIILQDDVNALRRLGDELLPPVLSRLIDQQIILMMMDEIDGGDAVRRKGCDLAFFHSYGYDTHQRGRGNVVIMQRSSIWAQTPPQKKQRIIDRIILLPMMLHCQARVER